MGTTAQESRNGVEVIVSNENLVSGWDIVNLKVDGYAPKPTKAGEFATQSEAKEAGFLRGEAIRKEREE
ncbi:hypothetical protein [Pseudomonas sp. IT-P294]|uniref:hypothetical protein n=1 Tax=Pseudomonas sp. IT-P294 TaxID=3026454 RepID=UPI0039E01198